MKRSWKLWVAAVLGAGVAQTTWANEPDPNVQPANGHILRRPYYPPAAPNCPTPYGPWMPGQPVPTTPNANPNPNVPNPNVPNPNPNGMPQPQAQPQPQTQAPSAPDTSFQGSRGGTNASHTNAPNLFGDLFGARSSQITLPGLTYKFQPGFVSQNQLSAAIDVPISGNFPGVYSGNLNNPLTQLLVLNANGTVRNFLTEQVSSNAPIQQYVAGAGSVPLSPQTAATINGALNYLASAPGTNVPNPSHVITARRFYEIAQLLNPNVRLTSLTFGNLNATASAGLGGPAARYTAPMFDQVAIPVAAADPAAITISVPTPGSGGVVGLLKMAEDNNPFPRDRLIFNYDYFDNVPMTVGGAFGLPVNRYQVGFEKTFCAGWGSFEVRLPFARTLSSSSTLGQDSLNTELGNLRMTVKGLLYRGEKFNISSGLGIALPTADDIIINGGGTELIHIENNSVQLSPFVATMWTPNDRLFGQAWAGFCFDTGGNDVRVNPLFFGAGPNIGSISGAPLLNLDGQIGYWVYQSDRGCLRGLAPFLELHYACDAGKGTLLNAGNGFLIGDTGGYEELNLTTGITTQLAQNSTLAVGAAFPMLGTPDRTFEYQIGVRFNYYFGYTASQRSGSTAVSTFGP